MSNKSYLYSGEDKNLRVAQSTVIDVSVVRIDSNRPTSFMKNYWTSADTSPLFSLGKEFSYRRTGAC